MSLSGGGDVGVSSVSSVSSPRDHPPSATRVRFMAHLNEGSPIRGPVRLGVRPGKVTNSTVRQRAGKAASGWRGETESIPLSHSSTWSAKSEKMTGWWLYCVDIMMFLLLYVAIFVRCNGIQKIHNVSSESL